MSEILKRDVWACEECLDQDLTLHPDDPERDSNYYCHTCESFTYKLNPRMLNGITTKERKQWKI